MNFDVKREMFNLTHEPWGGGAQRAVRPSAKGGSKGWEVVGRSAGRVVDGPGRSGRSME